MVGTYKIYNRINQRCYYGSSIDIQKRFIQHRCKLRKNKHHCHGLQNAWNKYGESNFDFIVIDECKESDLMPKENLLLKRENIYNSLKEAYSVTGENHPMYGLKHTKEARMKIKKARSKQKISHSEETRNKIGAGNKGRKVSKEHISKMVEARNGKAWNKGIKTGIEPVNKIKLDDNEIINLYESGNSIEKIRKLKNVSWDVIKRILVENNVKTRSIKEQKIITDKHKLK